MMNKTVRNEREQRKMGAEQKKLVTKLKKKWSMT